MPIGVYEPEYLAEHSTRICTFEPFKLMLFLHERWTKCLIHFLKFLKRLWDNIGVSLRLAGSTATCSFSSAKLIIYESCYLYFMHSVMKLAALALAIRDITTEMYRESYFLRRSPARTSTHETTFAEPQHFCRTLLPKFQDRALPLMRYD